MATGAEMCAICIEPYKGKRIQKVTCQYCPSNACRGCQQRYLLQTFEDPHCMECKRGWSPDFMAANFPMVFRNDTLRKWRRRVLLAREKAVLPAMQVYVEHKREWERLNTLLKEQCEAYGFPMESMPLTAVSEDTLFARWNKERVLRERRQIARSQLLSDIKADKALYESNPSLETQKEVLARLTKNRKKAQELKEELDATKEAHDALRDEYQQVRDGIYQLQRLRWRAQAQYEDRWQGAGGEGAAGGAAPARREFVMKCPAEECRGFLSQAYKCGTCEKHTCSSCLVVLGLDKSVEHTCAPDAVESAKTIKAETRPCPKCGTRIFKIDGCDQMYCTMPDCNTAFSWNTGQIETGRVHNPHYYDWLRRTGGGQAPREVGDIPCGGLPTAWQLTRALQFADGLANYRIGYIYEAHRNLQELIDYRMRDYPAQPAALANKDNDVNYMLGRIDEEEWQRQLEFTEARFKRKKEIGLILNMAATAGSDILRGVVARITDASQTGAEANANLMEWLNETVVPELEALREFANESLLALAKREHMAVPQFGERWAWKPLRALYRATPVKRKGAAAAAAGGGAAEAIEAAAEAAFAH